MNEFPSYHSSVSWLFTKIFDILYEVYEVYEVYEEYTDIMYSLKKVV